MLLALLAMAAGAALAQEGCAQPEPPLPQARFEDRGDGLVTDRRSRLTWMRCALGQQWDGAHCRGEAARLDWAAAGAAVRALNADGSRFYNDWRLPQLHELAQLSERRCALPRTDAAVFPDTPAAPFWSATPRAGETPRRRAYALDFGAEGVRVEDMHEGLHVRLVRSGP